MRVHARSHTIAPLRGGVRGTKELRGGGEASLAWSNSMLAMCDGFSLLLHNLDFAKISEMNGPNLFVVMSHQESCMFVFVCIFGHIQTQ